MVELHEVNLPVVIYGGDANHRPRAWHPRDQDGPDRYLRRAVIIDPVAANTKKSCRNPRSDYRLVTAMRSTSPVA